MGRGGMGMSKNVQVFSFYQVEIDGQEKIAHKQVKVKNKKPFVKIS